uniref:Photosystem II reaction center protein Z n=1 Tax=Aconitum habaense TaxID=2894518 RepID=A0A8K1T2R0_9MAGN|nr:photosystem II subunit Z [Aconitum habaense]
MVKSLHDAFYYHFWAERGIKWYSLVYLLVAWRIRSMTIAFQLAVFALIATSSILLISVPVVFASSDGWSSNKNVVFSGTSLWIGLVFLVAILNSLIS